MGKSMSLTKLAKLAGMGNIKCHNCGKTFSGLKTLKYLFDLIIKYCLDGYDVKVTGFGTFYVKKLKGRSVKSPILDGGEAKFEDVNVLRFRQTSLAKRRIQGE